MQYLALPLKNQAATVRGKGERGYWDVSDRPTEDSRPPDIRVVASLPPDHFAGSINVGICSAQT